MSAEPMTYAQILARARELAVRARLDGRRIALLSTCNLEFVRPYLVVAAEAHGVLFDTWLGPFNQLEQPVLELDSPLWHHRPELVLLLIRPDDVDPRLGDETQGIAPEEAKLRIDAIGARQVTLVRALRERFSGSILVANFALAEHDALDPFDSSSPGGITHVYAAANRKLAEELVAIPDTHVFDYAGAVSRAGGGSWRDERLWHMARIPVGVTGQADLARELAGVMRALLQPAAKCIVVDLDQTLWYVPSPKNGIVEDFYRQHGFIELAGGEPARRVFELRLEPASLPWPAHIRRASA